MLKVNEGPFDRFGGRFGRIIDPEHFLGRSAFDIPYSRSFPRTNVSKSGEAYHIDLLVPGFSREELKITVEHGMLIVRGSKSQKVPTDEKEFIIEEFDIESFERKFHLQKHHLDHHMEAFLENGILRIVFYHKYDPVYAQERRIPVSETE